MVCFVVFLSYSSFAIFRIFKCEEETETNVALAIILHQNKEKISFRSFSLFLKCYKREIQQAFRINTDEATAQ